MTLFCCSRFFTDGNIYSPNTYLEAKMLGAMLATKNGAMNKILFLISEYLLVSSRIMGLSMCLCLNNEGPYLLH